MNGLAFTLHLPEWLVKTAPDEGRSFSTMEDRMLWTVELSRLNVQHGGGPFAATIFCIEDGSWVSSGINMVVAGNCSVLHGEIVALMSAQSRLGNYDLSSSDSRHFELLTSTEPCAMCMGAVTWAGISRLVCGARGSDAEETGFDEGEKPANWPEALDRRGILVERDICREQAALVLKEYHSGGGIIYNPRRAGS